MTSVPIPDLVVAVFLAFCRIGACFMVMPGFSSARIPMQVRLFTALAVSLALFINLSSVILPFAKSPPAVLLPTIGSELLTGVLIGLMARLYILALEFMGTGIAMLMGFNTIGGTAIIEAEPQAPLSSLISFAALLILFALDFHLQIIKALIVSYRMAPPGALFDPRTALADLTDTVSQSFYVVLRLGSPFVAYAILVNFATGLLNKLTPQIPIYFISLPFIIVGGLVIIYFGISTMLSLYAGSFLPVALGQ